METKLEINSLEALRASINEAIENLKLKSEREDGWVIAGYGGETLYAYVGLGGGYMGACLAPCSISPLVFSSEVEAKLYAEPLDYRNGRFERIHLRPWSANSYFTLIIEELKKTIKTIDSL